MVSFSNIIQLLSIRKRLYLKSTLNA